MTTPNSSSQTIQPYLFFNGRCEEAIEFYRSALDAEVEMLVRFSDCPEPQGEGEEGCGDSAANKDKIMHANLRIGNTTLLASDGRCQGEPKFEGFSLSVSVADEAEAQKRFAALSEGGKVEMPLTKTFYSPCFGMVVDRFDVGWMIIVPQ
jgi:PhnB protein